MAVQMETLPILRREDEEESRFAPRRHQAAWGRATSAFLATAAVLGGCTLAWVATNGGRKGGLRLRNVAATSNLQAVPPPAPMPMAPVPQFAKGTTCVVVDGIQVAESNPTSIWPTCTAKWSADCRKTGCCLDAGMKCFEKNAGWGSCKATCEAMDDQNQTWTCRELSPPKPRTVEACWGACTAKAGCQQAVFNSDGGGQCSLSKIPNALVAWAGDNFKSAYCGPVKSQAKLQQFVDSVNSQLPYTLPPLPLQNCSWGGEDCSQTKCCNDVACDKDFNGCYGYSCYKKSEYFSGCSLQAPPADWEGTWIGGGREHRTIPPASSRVALQGTSLYCFTVVNWNAPSPKPFWSPEKDLANNIKNAGIHIMQCDGHDFYDGVETPKAEWGSFSNIDAFQIIWKQVKDKGSYKNFDWTVKVDADAIFFPNRLKQHLDKLKVPKGSRVYLENINFRFKFMGALEIVTQQALDVFLERSASCIRGDHAGGEDFFMKGCMDALGIDHMTDYDLLVDRYGGQDSPCTDGWAVAYHYRKKVISWNWCYNEAVCGSKGKTCPEGLEVEYVM